MIQIKEIFKKYGQKPVLEDVSITLPEGKMISFIGSNGAGKSTLLNIIARTLLRDKGEILIYDKPMEDYQSNELAQILAILNQNNQLNVRLTVKELISFGRFPYSKNHLTAADESVVHETMALFQLNELANRYLDELSGGQKQLAYIAMVIAQDTPYIFLDEPLNNLDMRHAVMVMKALKRLVAEKQKTIMVVIHDINFVSVYADYIFALKDGKIFASGSKEEMMNSKILNEVYNMKINIEHLRGCRICMFYD